MLLENWLITHTCTIPCIEAARCLKIKKTTLYAQPAVYRQLKLSKFKIVTISKIETTGAIKIYHIISDNFEKLNFRGSFIYLEHNFLLSGGKAFMDWCFLIQKTFSFCLKFDLKSPITLLGHPVECKSTCLIMFLIFELSLYWICILRKQ